MCFFPSNSKIFLNIKKAPLYVEIFKACFALCRHTAKLVVLRYAYNMVYEDVI